jgi:integrase
MARAANRLTAKTVEKASKPGMYADGEGLYLRVKDAGTKSWVFRFQLDKRERAMGLGPYPEISLAEAREQALEARRLRARSIDPIKARKAAGAASQATTFADIARHYVEAHRGKWKSPKSLARWERFERYACEAFGVKAVATVDTNDVLALLTPLWTTKPESAAKLREWVEGALDFAKAKGHREGENPARWRGNLQHALPARNKRATVRHHPALPWQELPAFMADLRGRDALAARALELTILCATRTSETLQADRAEISGALWTIPAARMKTGKEHRVPLSKQAAAIFATLPMLDGSSYVFPGHRSGRPLSGMAMEMLLRRMGRGDITVHGFRSTFRDWAAESTANFPREIIELCLAHDVSSEVERAYRRSDLLEKRRQLMQAWADFCWSERDILPQKSGKKIAV